MSSFDLHFPAGVVVSLLEHSLASDRRSPLIQSMEDLPPREIPVALALIADDNGIYLLGNGTPALPDPENEHMFLAAWAVEADGRDMIPDDVHAVVEGVFEARSRVFFFTGEALAHIVEGLPRESEPDRAQYLRLTVRDAQVEVPSRRCVPAGRVPNVKRLEEAVLPPYEELDPIIQAFRPAVPAGE